MFSLLLVVDHEHFSIVSIYVRLDYKRMVLFMLNIIQHKPLRESTMIEYDLPGIYLVFFLKELYVVLAEILVE